MDPQKSDSEFEKLDDATDPDYAPHRLGVRWTAGGKAHLFRIDLPWDSDTTDWAEAFQKVMAALGFSDHTIVEYIQSELLDQEAQDD